MAMENMMFAFGPIVVAGFALLGLAMLVGRYGPVVLRSIPKWVYGSLVLAMIAGLLLMMQASYDRLEARGMKAACQNFGSCVAFVFQNADAVRVWPLEMIVRAPDIQ
ncbi:MAG: hypothetical protein HYU59_01130 [Magnetospirillum gryphiswaldense]|nr:hypothetical protein [Magnetospirillum gryphiswaldense]